MAVRITLYLFLCALFAASYVTAQRTRTFGPDSSDDDQNIEIHGQILHEPGKRVDGLFIDVKSLGANRDPQRVPVSPSGEFSISGPASGMVILRVTGTDGNLIVEKMVSPAEAGTVQIELPKEKLERPPSGSVSLFELEHKVPSKALKEVEAGEKSLTGKQGINGYIEHIEKAVDIDPDYLTARRNLAVAYLKTGQNEKVVSEAIEILKRDPHSSVAYGMSAVAHLQLRQYAEAETAARRTLEIDGSNETSRYVLGVSLQLQHKDNAEALESLNAVSNHFPKAHVWEAEIFERLGDKQAAKQHLQSYLKSNDPDMREDAKVWLAALN